MTDPCRQEPNIATMQASIKSISDTLREIKSGQQRFIEVLERIAEQGQRIVNLEENSIRNEKDINALFGRVRDLEIDPKKETVGAQRNVILAILQAALAGAVGFVAAKMGK